MDVHQIGGLSAQSGTVVHDLRVDLASRVVEDDHRTNLPSQWVSSNPLLPG